jgi:hypothetical protein
VITTQFTFRGRRELSDNEPKFDARRLVVLIAQTVQALQYVRYGSLLCRCWHIEREHQNASDYPNANHQGLAKVPPRKDGAKERRVRHVEQSIGRPARY